MPHASPPESINSLLLPLSLHELVFSNHKGKESCCGVGSWHCGPHHNDMHHLLLGFCMCVCRMAEAAVPPAVLLNALPALTQLSTLLVVNNVPPGNAACHMYTLLFPPSSPRPQSLPPPFASPFYGVAFLCAYLLCQDVCPFKWMHHGLPLCKS